MNENEMKSVDGSAKVFGFILFLLVLSGGLFEYQRASQSLANVVVVYYPQNGGQKSEESVSTENAEQHIAETSSPVVANDDRSANVAEVSADENAGVNTQTPSESEAQAQTQEIVSAEEKMPEVYDATAVNDFINYMSEVRAKVDEVQRPEGVLFKIHQSADIPVVEEGAKPEVKASSGAENIKTQVKDNVAAQVVPVVHEVEAAVADVKANAEVSVQEVVAQVKEVVEPKIEEIKIEANNQAVVIDESGTVIDTISHNVENTIKNDGVPVYEEEEGEAVNLMQGIIGKE